MERKKYHVEEDIVDTVLETNDKDEAIREWKKRHRARPDLYHEIWTWNEDLGLYSGTHQYKPGDIVHE